MSWNDPKGPEVTETNEEKEEKTDNKSTPEEIAERKERRQNLKLECLTLATKFEAATSTSEDVVNRAKAYYNFVRT